MIRNLFFGILGLCLLISLFLLFYSRYTYDLRHPSKVMPGINTESSKDLVEVYRDLKINKF